MLERPLLRDPIDYISEYIGLRSKKVKRYKKISFEQAVKRFLPKGTLERMIDDGVVPDEKKYDGDLNMTERAKKVSYILEMFHSLCMRRETLRPYFETSKKGMEWFNSNFYDSELLKRIDDMITRDVIEQGYYLRQCELIEISKGRFDRFIG